MTMQTTKQPKRTNCWNSPGKAETIGRFCWNILDCCGIDRQETSQSVFRACLWCLVVLFAVGGCLLQSVYYLMTYWEYPAVVHIHVERRAIVEFPAVTFCNINTVRKSAFFCALTPYENRTQNCNKFNISNILIPPDIKSIYDLDDNILENVGHQIEDMLVGCSLGNGINTGPCRIGLFSRYLNTVYGNCFTFNARWDEKLRAKRKEVLTSASGITSSLLLTLDLEIKEYFSPIVGARISVHPSDELPTLETEGIDIEPATATKIAILQKTSKLLPHPFKDNCVNYETLQGERHLGKFTEEQCWEECLQNSTIMRCKCAIPFRPKPVGVRKCDIMNKTEIKCARIIEMNCSCPKACLKTKYETTVSSAMYVDNVHPSNNRVKVHVYFKTLEHMIYENQPKYLPNEIISVLGGFTGLWLGISLLGIFEFLEKLASFVYRLFNYQNYNVQQIR